MVKSVHKPDSAPTAESLASAARAASRKGPAPVHLWDPPFCGDLDMRIARDGTWFYLGTPIGRKPLVKLFSSVLKREGGDYFLVTPVEKLGITVDDGPFVAIDFTIEGEGRDQKITFTTQVDEEVTAGPEHAIRLAHDPQTGEPSPYVMVRGGMEALIDRKSFYRLVGIAVERDLGGEAHLGVWSGGGYFAFCKVSDLDGEWRG
jgi:hypothetical protein